ncbi:hypothetical protein AMR42_15140 [Limnothrix sp. PR1529]|uniref:hypothetical protein n=1 Tax=Limnothrix sp. PR1529 TaxID=1704291 RepID=UPI000C1610AA|nr:hypothetical protein [Limnothrix sp. PR1529]PIB06286.1 hypothetical protein AMR42_15140 [Limnothrix sp. PR1529]
MLITLNPNQWLNVYTLQCDRLEYWCTLQFWELDEEIKSEGLDDVVLELVSEDGEIQSKKFRCDR